MVNLAVNILTVCHIRKSKRFQNSFGILITGYLLCAIIFAVLLDGWLTCILLFVLKNRYKELFSTGFDSGCSRPNHPQYFPDTHSSFSSFGSIREGMHN